MQWQCLFCNSSSRLTKVAKYVFPFHSKMVLFSCLLEIIIIIKHKQTNHDFFLINMLKSVITEVKLHEMSLSVECSMFSFFRERGHL